jgi:F-type H+-transporting ATPase subunit delta
LKDVSAALKLSETAEHTLRLLSRKRRLAALPDLARQLARLADEEGSLLRAQVISAGPLSQGYLDRLKAELEKATGKKVTITHEQDPSLIAGVVTRIGDRVIDGSALARLNSFRDAVLSS